MKTITVPAALEQLEVVQSFIEEELAMAGCSAEAKIQIQVAVEEIYVNIACYAYHPQVGEATISCSVGGDPTQVVIRFLDQGNPFNPLDKEDTDISASAKEQKIGGLGILIVKKSMDQVEYAYENGKNILTIKKALQ